MTRTPKTNEQKRARAYERGMLVRALVSLFWVVISDKKRREKYTLQNLADAMGAHKSEVSRWFSGSPNWQLKTIADIAEALGLDLEIRAIDRATGRVFAPHGEMIIPAVTAQSGRSSLTGFNFINTDKMISATSGATPLREQMKSLAA